MKKVLAAVLAAAMSLSMAVSAFAVGASITVDPTVPGASNLLAGESGDYIYLDKLPNKTEITLTNADIFTYDDNSVKLYFRLATNAKVRADVEDGKVTVSSKKTALSNGEYELLLTVKGKYGVRDFDMDDWKIELDIGSNTTVTLKAEDAGAYSRTRVVHSGDRLAVTASKRNGSNDGCIFSFDEVIDEKTRIRCNDYVDVWFNGNYGTDKENMRVKTSDIAEVEEYFDDVDVDYYDFVGTPKFATRVQVVIDADKNTTIYEFNKKTGDLTKVDATYDATNGWSFYTKNLTTYVLTEEEYEEGNVKKEEPAEKDEPSSNEKDNPGTGANDMVGVASALAVVSLVAAGAVAFKKASK